MVLQWAGRKEAVRGSHLVGNLGAKLGTLLEEKLEKMLDNKLVVDSATLLDQMLAVGWVHLNHYSFHKQLVSSIKTLTTIVPHDFFVAFSRFLRVD